MASNILERYKSARFIRHPSWRVYKALADIRSTASSPEEISDLTLAEFGLSDNIEVYYPYLINDELTEEIIAALTDENYEDTDFKVGACLSLFCDITSRQLLEGMLLGGDLPEDIADELGYSISLVQTYAQVFFDTSVWRSDADKLAYITRGTIGKDAEIKRLIWENGLEYVRAHVFHMPAKLRMETALKTIFGDAYTVIMDKIRSGDNEDQKIAQAWARQSLDIFKELKNAAKGTGGIRELTIALDTSRAPRISIEDLE